MDLKSRMILLSSEEPGQTNYKSLQRPRGGEWRRESRAI